MFAFKDDTLLLLENEGVVTTQYLETTEALYNRVLRLASAELEAWMIDVWDEINVQQHEGDSSHDAWRNFNKVDPGDGDGATFKVFIPIIQ